MTPVTVEEIRGSTMVARQLHGITTEDCDIDTNELDGPPGKNRRTGAASPEGMRPPARESA